MAHKPFIAITNAWTSIIPLITAYDADKQYNIQNLARCNVVFCVSASSPLDSMSYTETRDGDVVVMPKAVAGLWAKCMGGLTGSLSVEEV